MADPRRWRPIRPTGKRPLPSARTDRRELDLRPLLGQPVLASPKPDAEVLATIAPEGLVGATETCPWVIFQHDIKWTKGRIRCGDVFQREPDTGEGTEEMVPVLETVTREGTRWSRIIATNGGRTGWVKAEKAPTRFTTVVARYSAGGARTWDRMLHSEPGSASPSKIEFRGAIALHIRETRTIDDRTWLRVEARVDQCIEGSRRKLGEGWMPQHAEDGGAQRVLRAVVLTLPLRPRASRPAAARWSCASARGEGRGARRAALRSAPLADRAARTSALMDSANLAARRHTNGRRCENSARYPNCGLRGGS